jgi:8-oxo-dGTP pyrophosphatase MutT (NUDIX family)
MTITPPAATTLAAPRASATVLIVRDTQAGLEVFMIARDRQVDMATGAVIFPGGKVDPDDRSAAWGTLSAPQAPDRAYWIAAVRETFEESGLLIAKSETGTIDAESAAHIATHLRTPLLDQAVKFSQLMTEKALSPALDLMAPFAHWVTPVSVPKRFETHFFLIAALEGQTAVHDGREAVSSFWMRPKDLLAEAEAGRQTLVPPTRLNIELLSESDTVAHALAAARARKVVTVTPTMTKIDGGMRLSIPADAGYRTTEIIVRR